MKYEINKDVVLRSFIDGMRFEIEQFNEENKLSLITYFVSEDGVLGKLNPTWEEHEKQATHHLTNYFKLRTVHRNLVEAKNDDKKFESIYVEYLKGRENENEGNGN